MPEAQEVRAVCEVLHQAWKKRIIIGVNWDEGSKFNKTGIKGLELITAPCTVIGVFPRGKLIIIECINRDKQKIYLVSQLGMSGNWTRTKDKYCNFRIYFGKLNPEKTYYEVEERYYFSDKRHFGHFNVYSDLSVLFKSHGPCLLTTALVRTGVIKNLRPYQQVVTLEDFSQKIKKTSQNKQICDFLMEQKHFSGVGNYLRAELLYRAKMNPAKTLGTFTDAEIKILFHSIMKQMLTSVRETGFQVYSQSSDPKGNPVETFKDKQKRTVHWVPQVQR